METPPNSNQTSPINFEYHFQGSTEVLLVIGGLLCCVQMCRSVLSVHTVSVYIYIYMHQAS